MLFIAILALQSVAPAEPKIRCTPDVYCNVPDISIGNGMKSNSPSAQAVIVPSSRMPPLPLAVPMEPKLDQGPHELVVHWPATEGDPDYQRPFKTGAACLKARSAVLDEHRRRTSAIAVNMSNRGTILAAMLEAPYAVCIPID